MLPKRPLKSSISAPGTPGGPQGVPKGRLARLSPLFRDDFEVVFDEKIDQISRRFFISKKVSSGSGI